MSGMDWESMKHRTIHTGKDRGIFCGTAAAAGVAGGWQVTDKRRGYIRGGGASRSCDGVMASHADVVSKGDIAYIFYFTHPYFTNEHRLDKSYIANAEDGRACIQAAQLEVKDGRLVCNRNQQFEMRL